MNEETSLAQQFEANRKRLKTVAYRMLGSISEAEDAVQEAWIRASRTNTNEIDNIDAWLTTVVSRLCLDALRKRKARREESLDAPIPDPIVKSWQESSSDPEQETLLTDSLGLAMIVVLDTLSPAERIAFVLHDTFSVPFEEIARILERSAAATRQLASRARNRVQKSAHVPNVDLARQHKAVTAFLAAVREGDLNALLAVLDPNVVLHSDRGTLTSSILVQGAQKVASGALMYADAARHARPVLINGAIGMFTALDGIPFSLMAFTVVDEKIVEIVALSNSERLQHLCLNKEL